MNDLEERVSVFLGVVGLTSLATLLLLQPSEGKIKLPEHDVNQDLYDVAQPVDFEDGTFIDEEKFWRSSRRRKIVMSILLAITLALEGIRLQQSLRDVSTMKLLISRVVPVVYAAYTLGLALRALLKSSIGFHFLTIVHIAVLAFSAFLAFLFEALVPGHSPQLPHQWTQTMVLVCYALIAFAASQCPAAPRMYFDPQDIYNSKEVNSNTSYDNVSGVNSASLWEYMFFTYTKKILALHDLVDKVEVIDLPIVPAALRSVRNYVGFRKMIQSVRGFQILGWIPGSGWDIAYGIVRLNATLFVAEIVLAVLNSVFVYIPPFFLERFIRYLEHDKARTDTRWGWAFAVGLVMSKLTGYMINNQLWALSTITMQTKIRLQLNSVIFAKTLVRKDIASSSAAAPASVKDEADTSDEDEESDQKPDFGSKAQVLNLMFTDTDRIADFTEHLFTLIDSPVSIVLASLFLYRLLGVSCLFGLGMSCLFLPLNHFAGSVVIDAQDKLMSSRDKRVALMNEVLGAIRMLKFMAWERMFAAKVLEIRDEELKHQRMTYVIETLWMIIWSASPILVTIVSFWHFTVVRGQDLTPSIAFTSIIVFNELKSALNGLPETFINLLQMAVSLRRIDKYLKSTEIGLPLPMDEQGKEIAFKSCTVTWPQSSDSSPSPTSTPRDKFLLQDLNLSFPKGELSLICGKLGSGKTLLLYALLGEADVLNGQVICPRSPPNAIANFMAADASTNWIIEGICAYVPQAAWLQNASIKDNILFSLPYDEARYMKTLEVCALVADLAVLEDGDESEIGEKGINLSGGQRARISLARAVYSRASILFLDDVLSAVDAHTAHHLYHRCLKGELMTGRTIILVSHHVQLCVSGAKYVVALDNGLVTFAGDREGFKTSDALHTLDEAKPSFGHGDDNTVEEDDPQPTRSDSSTPSNAIDTQKTSPKKLITPEKREVGHVNKEVWYAYLKAFGHWIYWPICGVVFILAMLSPVAETGWVQHWSQAVVDEDTHSPIFYIAIYALIAIGGLVFAVGRYFVLYLGSLRASRTLHARLLESVLFTDLRFHTTTSRGSLLNRFASDLEVVDSELGDECGDAVDSSMSFIAAMVSICVVGGWGFVAPLLVLGGLYYDTARMYGKMSRDLRRLSSITRSPQYSIVEETITGVPVIRAFGAPTKVLRDMLRIVDIHTNPTHWRSVVSHWMTIRLDVISCSAIALVTVFALLLPRMDASLAGFALTFADSLPDDVLNLVRTLVGLEQSMIALERVKEYSELPREPPEFMEPRPHKEWPQEGRIEVKDLAIRYAPDLPNVLHGLTFDIKPGEKVGILGRTGSGKSTIAMSFFRFVEPTEGSIAIDGLDISSIGLTDLRSKLTIIPQDPTILSGTLRSTLDVFDEYQDAEIFEALRRVHLIPSDDAAPHNAQEPTNANVFRDLESPISENGDNLSAGEKQLLCMARAILKRSRVVIMDEATSSIDNGMDQLIGKTIREEFVKSTILTIAHRLRTIIDYDRVMVLDNGHIVEFDSPSTLLQNEQSQFYSLCSATGKEEFTALKTLAGVH